MLATSGASLRFRPATDTRPAYYGYPNGVFHRGVALRCIR